MTSVTRREGFRYGAYMFGYWLALLLFSAILIAAGSSLIYFEVADVWTLSDLQGQALAVFGGVVAVLGVVVLGSGQFGLIYKVVSDGVDNGTTGGGSAGTSAAPGESIQPSTESEPEPDVESESGSPSTSPQSASTSFAGTGEATAESGTDFSSRSGSPAGREPATEQSPDETEATSTPEAAGSTPHESPAEASGGGQIDADTTGGTTDERRAADRPDGASGPDGEPEEEAAEPDRESPEAVASESEIAEELGFKRGDDPAGNGSPDGPGESGTGRPPPGTGATGGAPEENTTAPSEAGNLTEADSGPTNADTGGDEMLESSGGPESGDPLTPTGGSGAESTSESQPLEADEWETGEEKIAEAEAEEAGNLGAGGGGEPGTADRSEGGATDLGDTNDLVDVPSGAGAKPGPDVDDADQSEVESAVEGVDTGEADDADGSVDQSTVDTEIPGGERGEDETG